MLHVILKCVFRRILLLDSNLISTLVKSHTGSTESKAKEIVRRYREGKEDVSLPRNPNLEEKHDDIIIATTKIPLQFAKPGFSFTHPVVFNQLAVDKDQGSVELLVSVYLHAMLLYVMCAHVLMCMFVMVCKVSCRLCLCIIYEPIYIIYVHTIPYTVCITL